MTSSEARSPEAEVHQEIKDLKLQRLGNGFNLVQHCTRLKECYNGLCERIWKHWMLVLSRALTIVRIVQPLPPLLCSCLCNKTRITALLAEMFLQTRNALEIDPSKDNNHIRQNIIGDFNQSFKRLFIVLATFQRIFQTSI